MKRERTMISDCCLLLNYMRVIQGLITNKIYVFGRIDKNVK